MRTTLSVIVSNYNHGHYLEESLESILSQSTPADEVILVDDGSTDDSIQIADRLARKHDSLKIIRHDYNQGSLQATNTGLFVASGTLVGLFNSDNIVLPGLFEKALKINAHDQNIAVISGETIIRNHDSERKYSFDAPWLPWTEDGVCILSPEDFAAASLRSYLWLATSGTILNRASLVALGGMCHDLDWFSDWFAIYSMAIRGGVAIINEPLSITREADDSYGKLATVDPIRRTSVVDAFLQRLRKPENQDIRGVLKAHPILTVTPLGSVFLERVLRHPKDWDMLLNLMVRHSKLAIGRHVKKPPQATDC